MDSTGYAIIVAGATAVGKTEVASRVALRLGGEVISADARAVYRGMVIGTSAPVDSGIVHHLVGVLEPSGVCDAAWWAKNAARILDEIAARKRTPIVAGGTGLYIRALTDGVFDSPGKSADIRKKLQERLEAGENLHAALEQVDQRAAKRIHPNNIQRIVRALEVYLVSGGPISAHFDRTGSPAPGWSFLKYHLKLPRKRLYERINARVAAMFDSGWVEETRRLLDSGVSVDAPGMNAIGYREIASFIRGEIEIEDAREIISRKTRNYAKRQLTWFNNRPGYRGIDLSETKPEAAAELISDDYRSCIKKNGN